MNRRLLLLTLLAASCLAVYAYVHDRSVSPAMALTVNHDYHGYAPDDGVRMIDRRFDVSAGGELEVQVADADVQVMTSASQEARIEIFLDARDMDRARRYFEALNFRVEQHGNTISVTHDEMNGRDFSWNRTGGAQIHIRAQIPETFNAMLITSDGDVAVGDLHGRLVVHTSDGDIAVGSIDGSVIELKTSDGDVAAGDLTGDQVSLQSSDGDIALKNAVASHITLRTSDGNLMAERIQGELEAVTSDGDIRFSTLSGPNILVRTSDGNITVEDLSAGASEVVTSDGNIRLERVDSPLRASTSSGSVMVGLLKPADTWLRSTDGDIIVTAPPTLPANVHLKGSNVQISSSYTFAGNVREDEAEGRINGGGPVLEASTSDGSIHLQAD